MRMNTLFARHVILKVSTFFFVSWLVSPPAHAYIDPGTGSYLLQILFGLVMGMILMPKAIFRRVMFWRKGKKHKQAAEDTGESTKSNT